LLSAILEKPNPNNGGNVGTVKKKKEIFFLEMVCKVDSWDTQVKVWASPIHITIADPLRGGRRGCPNPIGNIETTTTKFGKWLHGPTRARAGGNSEKIPLFWGARRINRANRD